MISGGLGRSGDPEWVARSLEAWAAVARAVDGSQPLLALSLASVRFSEVEQGIRELVRWCRQNGATWQQIGYATGTTRQAAWSRYRDVDREPSSDQEGLSE